MYPTILIDIFLIIGLILYFMFLLKGYLVFKLGPNCEKTFFRAFLIFFFLEILWFLGRSYNLLSVSLIAIPNADIPSDHPNRYTYEKIQIILGILNTLNSAFFTYQLDNKLLYSQTGGKLGRGIIIGTIIALIPIFVLNGFWPSLGILSAIATLFILVKLRRCNKKTPKTKIYSRTLGIGLFLYSFIKIGFRWFDYFYDWRYLRSFFAREWNPDDFIFLKRINALGFILSFLFLGYGVIKTSHLPYFHSKGRSIYGVFHQELNTLDLAKHAAQYQFGKPNMLNISDSAKLELSLSFYPHFNKKNSSTSKKDVSTGSSFSKELSNLSTFSESKEASKPLCSKCNILVDFGAHFCPKCGRDV